MVYGEHGRRVLKPFSPLQGVLTFPWKKLYNHSMYVRAFCGVSMFTLSAWLYVGWKGYDVWFTPYAAVHHSIAHSFAHDLDHKRYPVEHHHDEKASSKH